MKKKNFFFMKINNKGARNTDRVSLWVSLERKTATGAGVFPVIIMLLQHLLSFDWL